MYHKTITSPKGGRKVEIAVSHVKSQQVYRLSIVPYARIDWLDPFAGAYIRLESGRLSKRKLEQWSSLIDQHADKIAKLFWFWPIEELEKEVLKLHA